MNACSSAEIADLCAVWLIDASPELANEISPDNSRARGVPIGIAPRGMLFICGTVISAAQPQEEMNENDASSACHRGDDVRSLSLRANAGSDPDPARLRRRFHRPAPLQRQLRL